MFCYTVDTTVRLNNLIEMLSVTPSPVIFYPYRKARVVCPIITMEFSDIDFRKLQTIFAGAVDTKFENGKLIDVENGKSPEYNYIDNHTCFEIGSDIKIEFSDRKVLVGYKLELD